MHHEMAPLRLEPGRLARARTDVPLDPTVIEDPDRLAAVARTGLFDDGPAPALDRLARLAARSVGAPQAFVTMVGADTQVIVGSDAPGVGEGARLPVSSSLCRFVVQAGAPLLIDDARTDPDLAGHPAVRDYGTVAYAGYPLRAPDGEVVGSFCVTDLRPRHWTEADVEVLREFAGVASSELALRQANRELAEMEAQQRVVLDSLETGVVACDGDGRVVLRNRAMQDLGLYETGRDVAEVGGSPGRMFEADGRTPLVPGRDPLARAYAGEVVHGAVVVAAGPAATPGSGPRRLLANGRPIVAADGRRLGAVVAVQDVTASERNRRVTEAQNAVARALADATSATAAASSIIEAVAGPLGWIGGEHWLVEDGAVSRTGTWLSGHPGAATDADRGVGAEEVLDELGGADLARRVVDSGRAVHGAVDGSSHGIGAVAAIPVRSGGRLLGVLTFYATDVTAVTEVAGDRLDALDPVCAYVGRHLERRRAEDLGAALRAAQQDFDRVVRLVNDFMWTVEILPDGTSRTVFVSPDSGGVSGGELPEGVDLLEFSLARARPEDTEAIAEFRRTLAAGRSAELEVRFVGLDGMERWVWSRAAPRVTDGRILVDGISTNVTERHHLAEQRERLLEAERAQVARLRQLDAIKDELVAVVSHELRTPLMTIRGFLELLLDDPTLTDEQRDFASVADRTGAQLQRLADGLIDVARFESGPPALRAERLDLAAELHEVVAMHRPAAAAAGLELAIEIGDVPAVVADGPRLRQVLDNLLSNAVKYTPPGGSVTVKAGSDGAGMAVVTVRDTGIGIPPGEHGRLFSRFFRASTALERGIEGTGLGLAVSKALIEAHGGTLGSAPGPAGGSVFTVTLPASP